MTRAGRREDDEGDEAPSTGSRPRATVATDRPRTRPDRARSGAPRPAAASRPSDRPRTGERPRTGDRGRGPDGERTGLRSRDGGRPGEPLRAAWDPVEPRRVQAATTGTADGGRRSGAWRLYAVPLLVVLTVLAVFQAVSPSGTDSVSGAGVSPTQSPIVGEAPAGTGADVNIPTAELPGGGAFPTSGTGTWHVVPGASPQAGSGRVYTYTVEVEDGAVLPEGDNAFATAVDATLTDPRSWIGSTQIAVRRVDASSGVAPDFRVSLTSQLTTRAQCGYDIRYEASCWKSDIGRVLINGARWVRGAAAFDGQLGLYRQYAINHEVGHVFRNQHVPCPQAGGLAPVMMQQSFGVSNDYLAQLTEENPQGTQIPRDGKTCQPNAWPYPQGAVSTAG